MLDAPIATLTTQSPLRISLVDLGQLRDQLEVVLGTRPSRELVGAWRARGMPFIPLGARTIRYEMEAVLAWIWNQTVTRVAPTVSRAAGHRIVSDPRLRRPVR